MYSYFSCHSSLSTAGQFTQHYYLAGLCKPPRDDGTHMGRYSLLMPKHQGICMRDLSVGRSGYLLGPWKQLCKYRGITECKKLI